MNISCPFLLLNTYFFFIFVVFFFFSFIAYFYYYFNFFSVELWIWMQFVVIMHVQQLWLRVIAICIVFWCCCCCCFATVWNATFKTFVRKRRKRCHFFVGFELNKCWYLYDIYVMNCMEIFLTFQDTAIVRLRSDVIE